MFQNVLVMASDAGSRMPSSTTILIICVVAAIGFSIPSIMRALSANKKDAVDTTQTRTVKSSKNKKNKSKKVPSAYKASMSRKASYNNVYLNSGKNKGKSKGKGKKKR